MAESPKSFQARIAELEARNTELQAKLDLRNAECVKLAARLSAASDIAEHKRIETELRSANRALRAISDCNQALMRMPDEKELLESVCRIVVQTGGYRYAWVGYAEDDEGKSIRPVASAGFAPGFLETMRVS